MSNPKVTWGGSKEDFKEEEELRQLAADRRTVHDCAFSECDTGPDGVNLFLPNGDPNPAANPGIRPPPSARETALRNKHIKPRR